MVLPESSKPRPSRLRHEMQLHVYGVKFAECNKRSRVMHKATAIVPPTKIPGIADDAKKKRQPFISPSSPWGPWSLPCHEESSAGSCAACLFGGVECQPLPCSGRKTFLHHRPVRSLHRGGERTLLPARLLDLGGQADADQPVVGLELLHRLGRVVDEGKAGGLAATELGPETEDADLILLGLVHAGELVAELLLGDVGAVRVEDVTVTRKSDWSARVPSARNVPTPDSQRIQHVRSHSRVRDVAMSVMQRQFVARHTDDWIRGRAGRGTGGDSHDHLLATEQRVADELARAQRDRRVGVGHLGGLMAVDVGDTSTISISGGFKWDFPLGGDFCRARCCARVELEKIRSRAIELCASPNLRCGLAFQAANNGGVVHQNGMMPHIITTGTCQLHHHARRPLMRARTQAHLTSSICICVWGSRRYRMARFGRSSAVRGTIRRSP